MGKLKVPGSEVSLPAEYLGAFDIRIISMVLRQRPWTEIAKVVNRSVPYIKKIVAMPEFQKALVEYAQDFKTEMVEVEVESITSAQQARQEALRVLRENLNSQNYQAQIASAKTILEEANREKAFSEGKEPISLAEVRAMGRDEAKRLIQDLSGRRR